MPDDCGLKPPIDTLPQIAQERAIGSSEGDSIEAPGRKGPGGAVLYDAPPPVPTGSASPQPSLEAILPEAHQPGQALATRRAVTDIVRTVTLGSYGVVSVGGAGLARWLGWLFGR